MMKQSIFTILTNEALTPSVYRMTLSGDTSAITAPGQFVNIRLAGKFLRRPISVCDWEDGKLTLVDKVVGHGTAQMAAMYGLAKHLRAMGKEVQVILGFNTREEIFYEQEFKDLGCTVTVTTADGSYGVKGFVTDAMKNMHYSHFCACGPEPMLKALHAASTTSGQMSFEERMGCGFGACMGCSCKTLTGSKRICKDGPVMKKEEILWD